jgi:hypothetical protein
MHDFIVYDLGIVYAAVCTSLTEAETVARVNEQYPTGIDSRWEISKQPNFATGEPHPCPCEKLPITHKHYLLSC